jgi:hypothetical protein
LMRSININELRRVIPRYSNTINEPNVSLKYPDIARLRLPAPTSKSLTADIVLYCYALAAVAELSTYSPATVPTPAAIAIKRSTRRKKQSNRP